MYLAKLRNRIATTRSRLCAGLDPQIERQHVATADALRNWSLGFVESLHDLVPAFKFQSAYFEAHGPTGLSVLKEAIDRANSYGAVTVLDSKRGDIGSTLTEFIETAFPMSRSRPFHWDVDAITLNPSLGLESIPTILASLQGTRWAVYLVVTPTADQAARLGPDLRSQMDESSRLIAAKAAAWAKEYSGGEGQSNLGLVVSAINPHDVESIASGYSLPLLVPGIGVQQGDLAAIAGSVLMHEGSLFSVSRGLYPAISCNDPGWRTELRARATDYRRELNTSSPTRQSPI